MVTSGKPFTRVMTAGGIIFRRKGAETEFFFIRDGHGKWTFPKGKRALGETLAETAIREIREETGMIGLKYIAPIGRTSFRFRQEGTLIEKTVFFFLFEAPANTEVKLPGIEGITEANWFKAAQAFSVSGYRNLDRLVAKALRLVGGMRGGA